jgi:hypothetical protein
MIAPPKELEPASNENKNEIRILYSAHIHPKCTKK